DTHLVHLQHCSAYRDPRDLHSFPTRRSSDLADVVVLKVQPLGGPRRALEVAQRCGLPVVVSSALETSVGMAAGVAVAAAIPTDRSEEHTSELQSRENLVCRLLLEKKKQQNGK